MVKHKTPRCPLYRHSLVPLFSEDNRSVSYTTNFHLPSRYLSDFASFPSIPSSRNDLWLIPVPPSIQNSHDPYPHLVPTRGESDQPRKTSFSATQILELCVLCVPDTFNIRTSSQATILTESITIWPGVRDIRRSILSIYYELRLLHTDKHLTYQSGRSLWKDTRF